jgi:hypothetical protein
MMFVGLCVLGALPGPGVVEPAVGAAAGSSGSPSWADTGNMIAARSSPAATLLDDGKVLVVGGAYAPAELFDPATGTFGPTPDTRVIGLELSVWPATATRLLDGRVLLVGAGSPISGADTVRFTVAGKTKSVSVALVA